MRVWAHTSSLEDNRIAIRAGMPWIAAFALVRADGPDGRIVRFLSLTVAGPRYALEMQRAFITWKSVRSELSTNCDWTGDESSHSQSAEALFHA